MLLWQLNNQLFIALDNPLGARHDEFVASC